MTTPFQFQNTGSSFTRNKNQQGNYIMEQHAISKTYDEKTYINASQGQAFQTNFCGDGLLSGRIAGRDLAKDDTDVESFLFGIGSGNLIQSSLPMIIENKNIKSMNIFKKEQVRLPTDIIIDNTARPMFLN